ncbi:SH3 domain-containing protein [Streptoalloteichus hindustanus]|uniref:Uncharacterized protein n=1 Tax=Streptoalloteichus hindustanus TaxID=2017 RepID=A0A1M5IYW1_STRHI|nr:SH3 domain-containing protein [Streptoalloteichus hindustanus]SHG33315.1 hypothetical protein SAMN05444320_10856 [Streptoalloteichus hindustanus]
MSMRKFLSAIGVAGVALLASATFATTASAAPSAEAAPQAAFAKDCRWRASETVKIRNAPRTSAAAIGQVNKGERVCATGHVVNGGKYTACGRTDDRWVPIGRGRYIAGMCIEFTG